MGNFENHHVFPGPMTPGLTKRELFAAMAMHAFTTIRNYHGWTAEEVATRATAQADALLAELERAKR